MKSLFQKEAKSNWLSFVKHLTSSGSWNGLPVIHEFSSFRYNLAVKSSREPKYIKLKLSRN